MNNSVSISSRPSQRTWWILGTAATAIGIVYWQRANIAQLISKASEELIVWVAQTNAFRNKAGPLLASEGYRPHVVHMLFVELKSNLKQFLTVPAELLHFGTLTI